VFLKIDFHSKKNAILNAHASTSLQQCVKRIKAAMGILDQMFNNKRDASKVHRRHHDGTTKFFGGKDRKNEFLSS